MKTLRLSPELETRLERAAAAAGETTSAFIRQAAAERADRVLDAGDRDDFADVLGVVHGGGGRARRTGSAFADIVGETARNR